MIVKAGLEQNMKDRNKIKDQVKKPKSEQIREVQPKGNLITINKGKSEIILTYNKHKGESPTSIKVYMVDNNNEDSDITTLGTLSSSPFQWSLKDTQENLKSTLGNKLKVEISYNGNKVTKNYKIKYKN